MEKVFGTVLHLSLIGGYTVLLVLFFTFSDAEGAALFPKTGLWTLAAGNPEFQRSGDTAKPVQSDSLRRGEYSPESGKSKL